jgi:hypothetical protein
VFKIGRLNSSTIFFFKKANDDHNPALVGRFHDSDSNSEESDRIIPQNSMFGTRENFHDDQEEDEEQDSTGFESSYNSENSINVRFISYSKCF